jgi:beta-glucosidase
MSVQPGRFPDGFLWGAATAAYQIEGAVDEDGRSPSIWDTFSHTPGKVLGGDTGDVACDHYHRWQGDIGLMRELGLGAYRFSVAWPRVMPGGTGPVNERGLDWYDRLVDGLLAAGITPFVTLYHWDLPQALQDRGGWGNRATVDAFVAYAEAVARRLGDRVQHWITHNEPWVVAFLGNLMGIHAPGLQDRRLALQVAHHLLLSHGRAVPALRAAGAREVGITLNMAPGRPLAPGTDDDAAARRFEGFMNRWFLDPLFRGGYPEDMVALYGGPPAMEAGDLAAIAAPTDFLGVNYYTPATVHAVPPETNPLGFAGRTPEESVAAGYEVTEMGWAVDPTGLSELLTDIWRDYTLPGALYITENGAAFDDRLVDGAVDDPRRIAYLHGHLAAARQVIEAGVPLRGYFAWSLLDNFEWSFGYSKRFGLVYTDYATQARIPKASARWYSRVSAANGLVAPPTT